MFFCIEKCWFLITVFFLLNVLIWSIFMLGIKRRMVLKSELDGLHENVQHFDPRCLESREMHKPKKATTLRDTLYTDPLFKLAWPPVINILCGT